MKFKVTKSRAGEARLQAGEYVPAGPVRIVKTKMSLCSVCGQFAHASETDDHDRCARCVAKAAK